MTRVIQEMTSASLLVTGLPRRSQAKVGHCRQAAWRSSSLAKAFGVTRSLVTSPFMCGPHFCSMKITEDVRKFAAEQRLSESEALKAGRQ